MSRVAGLLFAFLCVPLVSNLPAQSGGDLEHRVQSAKEKIHDLRVEAEAWAKKGWETRAAEFRKKAEIMERELRLWLERRERDRVQEEKRRQQRGQGDKDRIVGGLMAGARALRELGRIDQAEQMEKLAEDVARRRDRRTGEDDKRALARRYLRSLRFAVVALVETDQHESAARIEHVMHAIELSLEGRKDEEANRIRREVPKAEVVLEDLERAIRVLRKQGKKDKSQAVLEVLHRMEKKEKARRSEDKEERAEEEVREEMEEEEEREREHEREDAQKRIEELEKRMKKLERYLEKLNRTLEKKKRD